MFRLALKKAGTHVAHRAVSHHAGPGGMFDIRYGFALLKSREVPVSSKLLALFLGVALTGTLFALEAPLELILGVFVPFLGVAADTIVDGLEIVALPLVFASLLLPRLASPKLLSRSVR